MVAESKDCKALVWWVWGVLDAVYLVWYMVGSLRLGDVPYFTDARNALYLLRDHDPALVVMVVLSWVLQLSMVISCCLFLARRDEARWVGYFQLPLRLIFIMPSVSVFLIRAKYLPGYGPFLIVILVVLSEAVKGWSLWRFGRRQRVK